MHLLKRTPKRNAREMISLWITVICPFRSIVHSKFRTPDMTESTKTLRKRRDKGMTRGKTVKKSLCSRMYRSKYHSRTSQLTSCLGSITKMKTTQPTDRALMGRGVTEGSVVLMCQPRIITFSQLSNS